MKPFYNIFYLALLCLIQLAYGAPAAEQSKNIVRFEVTLTWEDWEVAGAVRKTILTNGQFPGPELRVRQGDYVEFLVNNQLPFDTAIHFHGIQQLHTPWSDGVPGLSQRPIKPGQQFLYMWLADEYGSYFYHGHSRGQIDDGLYGAIYIEPHGSVDKPFGLITQDSAELEMILYAERNTRPVFLSDWTLLTSDEVRQAEEASGLSLFCVNALLINGKGSVQCLEQDLINEFTTPEMKSLLGDEALTDMACMPPLPVFSGGYPTNPEAAPPGFYRGCEPFQGPTEIFEVDPAAGYVSWDLISSAGIMTTTFSIDEHPMWVYAADGRYIEPMLVDAIAVPNGVRYSVLVRLDKPAGDYTIRAVNAGPLQIITTTAIMTYTARHEVNGPSMPYIDITGRNATQSTVFYDETNVVPFPVELPAMRADETYKLTIDRHNAAYRWKMGVESFPLVLNNEVPALLNPDALPQGLHISTRYGSWVDLIFAVATPIQPPHPIHKHSNKYFVIGQGLGSFDYESVEEAMQYIPENFNFVNPQLRDTYVTPAAVNSSSWLAVRYHVTNPGAFMVHCHIQVHFGGGMAMALLDGLSELPPIPREYLAAGLD